MVLNLSFHQTEQFSFPQADYGGGTAMTVCMKTGDPMLAFLTQEPHEDTLYLLDRCDGHVLLSFQTPSDLPQISGMGWDPINNWIYCGSGHETRERVVAFDPDSETITRSFNLPNPDSMPYSDGFATNGFFMVYSQGDTMEMRAMNGVLLGNRRYPGRNIRGVSASPNGWTFIDAATNEIVVTDPFGREIAMAQAPGPVRQEITEGAHAVVFDYINFPMDNPAAQRCIAQGVPPGDGDPNFQIAGSPWDPLEPWSPPPWLFQHRIYVANQTTQQVYVGYLTP